MRLALREHPSFPPPPNPPKNKPLCFLQVSIVTQNQAASGHAAKHLSEIAQAMAGYYLWCLVMEPHC